MSAPSEVIITSPDQLPPGTVVPDMNRDRVFAAVGHAITQWEYMEAVFAVLFSIAKEMPLDNASMAAYGDAAPIFNGRMQALEKSLANYFVTRPNQETEGNCHAYITEAQRLSVYRHHIAHGVCVQVTEFGDTVLDENNWTVPIMMWRVMPPIYSVKKLTKKAGAPWYKYGSEEIDKFAAEFLSVARQVWAMCDSMHQP